MAKGREWAAWGPDLLRGEMLLLSLMIALAAIWACWYALGLPRSLAEPELAAGHRLQCVSYAPFADGESPADLERGLQLDPNRIDTDLGLLAQRFDCIRIYSVTGLTAVPAYAQKHGLQLLLGIWVSSDPIATRKEMDIAIRIAKTFPKVVRAVIVGNEALLRKDVTGQQLTAYLREVKAALPGVAITYADVWEFWLKNPEVAAATDFVTIHILPYWEDDPTAIDDAIAHVAAVRSEVVAEMPGKDILIGEAGWPSAGRVREGALPSPLNQARFMRGLVQLAEREGWQYNLIEAFDQPWKRVNEGAVGGYWGLYDEHRRDKGALSGPVSNYPQWQLLAWQSVAIAALTALLLFRQRRPLSWSAAAGLTAVIAVGAVLVVLQCHQFTITARNLWEYLWAMLVLALAGGGYLVCVQILALGPRPPLVGVDDTLLLLHPRRLRPLPAPYSLLRTLVVLFALVETLGLVFDSRYRSFNSFAFALPVLACWLLARPGAPDAARRPVQKFLAGVLAAGAGFILVNETPLNWQADIWVAACLALAWPLWRESRPSPWPPLTAILVIGLLSYGAAAAIRYGVMESAALVGVCAEQRGGLCALRNLMGALIHTQTLGGIALGSAIAALLFRRSGIALAALCLSIFGLTLYNAGLSAYAAMAALVIAATLASRKRRASTAT